MAELDLGTIRAAVADQIKQTIDRQVNVYGGYLPTNPDSPAVLVEPGEEYVTFQGSLGTGPSTINLRLRCLVEPGLTGMDGQMVLDELLSNGSTSIRQACQSDPSFGGAVNTSHVLEAVRWDGLVVMGLPDSQAVAWSASVFLTLTHTRK